MVFPVVMYGCESRTIKKAEHQRIDAFDLWYWRRLLRIPWTAKRSNQSILKEISSEYSLEGLMLKLKLQYFGHLMGRTDSLEMTLMLERLNLRGEREDRGWNGWMASLTQCTWVWVSSGSWWWTWKPGVLQSIGSQRVRHNWLNWTDFSISTIQQNYFQALGYTVLDSPTRTGWGFVDLWGEGKYGYGTKSEPRDYESAPSMKALWQGEERNMKTMTKSEDERVRNKEENRTH